MATALDLPPELWVEILHLLSPADFLALMRTHKHLRTIVREHGRFLVNTIITSKYLVVASLMRTEVGPHGWLIPTHPAVVNEEKRLAMTKRSVQEGLRFQYSPPTRNVPVAQLARQPPPSRSSQTVSALFGTLANLCPLIIDPSCSYPVARQDRIAKPTTMTARPVNNAIVLADPVRAAAPLTGCFAVAVGAARNLSNNIGGRSRPAARRCTCPPSSSSSSDDDDYYYYRTPPAVFLNSFLLTAPGPQYFYFLRAKARDLHIGDMMFQDKPMPLREEKYTGWVSLYCVRRILMQLQWAGELKNMEDQEREEAHKVKTDVGDLEPNNILQVSRLPRGHAALSEQVRKIREEMRWYHN